MDNRSARAIAVLGVACLLAVTVFGARAQSNPVQSGLAQHLPVHKLRPASPPPGYAPPTVASLRLRAADSNVTYWIKATENPYAFHSCPTHLIFAVGSPGHLKTLFDYASCDWLQYMLPGGDGSTVITEWETGSAIMTRVFELTSGGARLVLERGTHLPPEFILGGILINAGWVPVDGRCCTAARTEIWTWAGNQYRLTATVPFDERYEALATLEHGASKK